MYIKVSKMKKQDIENELRKFVLGDDGIVIKDTDSIEQFLDQLE